MVYGFFIGMGGFVEPQGDTYRPVASHSIGAGVDFNKIIDVDIDEIEDHSKGDEVSKGLALLQTFWFIAQCGARGHQGLPLTELEIVTLAFATLNIVIRIIWWQKPLDVRYPIKIGQRDVPLTSVVNKVEPLAPTWRNTLLHALIYCVNCTVEMFEGEEDNTEILMACTRVPTLWAGRLSNWSRAVAATIGIFLAMGFGAVHFAAWNIPFLTNPERILWRVATVTVVAIPVFFFVGATVVLFLRGLPGWYHTIIFRVVIPLGIFVYVVARAILMVLPFISLRSLPPNVYKDVEWTSFIPHMS
jgi:hypothetical protein